MELSPKERKKIYEEEKARRESEGDTGSSTNLKPNTAGLLCYLGVWVTGIIFLIIERKNRIVRFHAMQSLVTFGILGIVIAIADAVRSWTPWWWGQPGWNWFFQPQIVVANIVFGVFMAISIVLWLVMMYQTYHGRLLKLAVFGELAQKLLAKLDGIQEGDLQPPAAEPARSEPEPPPAAKEVPVAKTGLDAHLEGTRVGRIAASVANIVWSSIFLVFFNFFSKYFAVYSREAIDGITRWHAYPLFTPDLSSVLPILNVTLILSIIGHSIAIAVDKYLVRQIILIVLHILGMITVITFIRVFPFDFSVVPHAGAAAALPTVALVIMILIAIGLGVGALVRFVKLIVNLAKESGRSVSNPPA
ncbi:MAG: hypothetical protein JW790_02190 [Dehalococcoidales bacterium]|nr:hypothetical protein [Dehalococcoidales bacterium]